MELEMEMLHIIIFIIIATLTGVTRIIIKMKIIVPTAIMITVTTDILTEAINITLTAAGITIITNIIPEKKVIIRDTKVITNEDQKAATGRNPVATKDKNILKNINAVYMQRFFYALEAVQK